MSEEAKLAYLQEQLKEVRRNERFAEIGFFIGIFVAMFGLIPNPFGRNWTIYGIIGIFIAGGGLVSSIYMYRQHLFLMKQLGRLAIVNPKCPQCGKELPKGNYAFCPFCGKSLTK